MLRTALVGLALGIGCETPFPPPLPPRGGPPQEPPSAPAPAPAPEGWRTVRARTEAGSDTIALTQPTRGYRLERATVQASPRAALICFEGRGPFEDFVLRDARILVEPGTLELDRAYWGIRGYDLIDARLERVEITGFGRVTPKHDEGHAVYLNLAGGLSVIECDLHHNGGQALQLVDRPDESVLAPGPARGAIVVRATKIRENGFNPDRSGFQVSIFGTGQTVELQDVEIVAGFDDATWNGAPTGGGLLIEAEAYVPGKRRVWWRPADAPEGFEAPFTQRATTLERVVVRHRAPSKPLVQIKGCESLEVRDCTFEGGKVVLDDPTKPGRSSGRIVWKGNRGDAQVFVEGRAVGSASEDFEIDRGGASAPGR